MKFSELNNNFFKIDLQDNKVFLEINYTKNINNKTSITDGNKNFFLKNILSFVAIKNSIHSEKGYIFSNFEITKHKELNIANFFKLFMDKFNVN
tara:strand:- start:233 stop:514 length:282 start_codon:yes stop_codon:yes gene_type:complete